MVPTSIGGIEARHMGRAESGASRWQVAYPWGVETFFGTSAEVAADVQRRAIKAGSKIAVRVQQAPRGMPQSRDA
jgi:hypothetical protein